MQCNGAPSSALNIETFAAVLERCTRGRRAASGPPAVSIAGSVSTRIAWLSTRVATGTGARVEAPRMRSDRTSETGVALAAKSITLQRHNFLIYQQFLHAFTDIIILILNTYRSSSSTYCMVKACNFLIAVRNNHLEYTERVIHIYVYVPIDYIDHQSTLRHTN